MQSTYRRLMDTHTRTGIGASHTIDAVYALRGAPCGRILFLTSVGKDGACRYITEGTLRDSNCFGALYHPDAGLFQSLRDDCGYRRGAVAYRQSHQRGYHIRPICAHRRDVGLGADCIEMETAALFKSAASRGLSAAALFSVSDNSVRSKLLYAGQADAEMAYRVETLANVLTRIALAALGIDV